MATEEQRKAFLSNYNVGIKQRVAVAREGAVTEHQKNPTLQVVAQFYGKQTAIDWVGLMLDHTFAMCGFDFMLGYKQTVSIVAEQLYNDYNDLKLGEVALFLSDFERGELGDFNTRFNSQKFYTALRNWLKVRADLRIKVEERKRAEQRVKMAENAVPCPEDLDIARYFVSNYKE